MTYSNKVFFLLIPYTFLLLLLGIFLPVIQDYYTQDYFKYVLYAIFGIFFVGILFYVVSSIKDNKLIRYSGIIFIGLLILLLNRYISATMPIFLAALREKIHIFEYGFLGVLFYHSFKSIIVDKSIYLWSIIYSSGVGLLDEFLQHIVSNRVGDIRDVLINLMSGIVGALFILIIVYPANMKRVKKQNIKKICLGLSILILFFGLFIYFVQTGYVIKDREIGEFKSRYSVKKLKNLSLKREQEWKIKKEKNPQRFKLPQNYESKILSLEDHYLKEAKIRTGKRNVFFRKGEYLKAFKENRILEKYYQPFLIYFSQNWSEKQRLNCLKEIETKKNDFYQSEVLGNLFTKLTKKLILFFTLILSLLVYLLSIMTKIGEKGRS
ncbi:MAG: VanZ family protein [Candidatus Aminicenantia bacterium]